MKKATYKHFLAYRDVRYRGNGFMFRRAEGYNYHSACGQHWQGALSEKSRLVDNLLLTDLSQVTCPGCIIVGEKLVEGGHIKYWESLGKWQWVKTPNRKKALAAFITECEKTYGPMVALTTPGPA
jgi:hypothetical protein